MAFAADQERWSAQSWPRLRRVEDVDVFVVHHQASVDDDATIDMMVDATRQVSAQWTVDNDTPLGGGLRGYARITAVVPENRRAWTSGSDVDDRAFTVECANSSGAPYWGIDPLSFEAVARLIAYTHLTTKMPLRHATRDDPRGVVGHNEVAAIYGGSYPTACPGNLNVDQLVARAQQLVGNPDSIGGGLTQEDLLPALTDSEQRELLAFVHANADLRSGGFIRMDQQIIPMLRNLQDVTQVLLNQAIEDQIFRTYRDMDDTVGQTCWMLAPGIEWLVPNGDYLAMAMQYRLTGPPINVVGDGSGNVMGWIRSMYGLLTAKASNQDIIDKLSNLDLSGVIVPEIDLSGIDLPALADIARAVADENDRRERARLAVESIPAPKAIEA